MNQLPAGPQPPAADAQNPGAAIDYGLFLDCVHCGLCTAHCPTYLELGDENDSPRGRIYLMRAVTDGRLDLTDDVRRHLELCLDCRGCETACPSGVQYGKLIEPFRVAMEGTGEAKTKTSDWFHRWILYGLFPWPNRMRWALAPARLAQRLGLMSAVEALGLDRVLPSRLRQLTRLLPPPVKDPGPLPREFKAKGKRRATVALFTGCVADVMFRHTHWATARVLQENGCDVLVPPSQMCCGAIHFHSGAGEPARQFADANLAAFDRRAIDAVIVNVAGCGSMLKDYGHHWEDSLTQNRKDFAAKVKDVSEFLDELGLIPPQGEVRVRAAYHDACHLAHAQKVRERPRNLLSKIPGLELVELRESDLCCGAAGTYNLTEPEMAARLGTRKLQNILASGARAVITANAGCILQIAREARRQGEPLRVVHPMDLLDMSYRGEKVAFVMKQFFLGGAVALIAIVGVLYFIWRLVVTLYTDWELTRDFEEIRSSSRARRAERRQQQAERLSNGCQHEWADEHEGFPSQTCRKCGLQREQPYGECDHIWRPAAGPVPGTICERCGERHAGGALYGGRSTE